MTSHADLVKLAGRWLRGTRRCCLVLEEPIAWSCREIPDAIGFEPKGRAVVIEAKSSRSDFLSDRRKPHRNNGDGLGQERWYLAPRGVINADDDLRGWGHLELRGARVYKVRHPLLPTSPSVIRPETPLLVAVLRRQLAKELP